MCSRRLNDGPLVCTRLDAHDPQARGGHTYAASDCADRHDASEADAEGRRG